MTSTELTVEEKRIKIAEACGAKWFKRIPDGTTPPSYRAPAYFNDLNAMHAAEKKLQPHLYAEYVALLAWNSDLPYWRATAAQRAEAFGKTLGLW